MSEKKIEYFTREDSRGKDTRRAEAVKIILGEGRMKEYESIVLNIINTHKGKENAISVPELTKKVNDRLNLEKQKPIMESYVRRIVRDLIMDHGKLIGSTLGTGGSRVRGRRRLNSGYYMITDKKEIREVVESLKSRGLKILQRGAKIRRVGLLRFIGQLKLELEDES